MTSESTWILLWPHIIGGSIALIAGALALSARKGATLHRQSGSVFVWTMLLMSGSGAIMAMFVPARVSVVAGGLTFYLVATSLLTVTRTVERSRRWITGFMLLGLIVGALGIKYGLDALASPKGTLDGYPAPPHLVFGAVGLIGAVLDARLLYSGSIQGKHRLARHLWRMCFAMLIATSSFFLGQAKLFPEPLRNFTLLLIPVFTVLLVMLYWIVRVLFVAKPLGRSRIASQAAHQGD